MLSVKLRSRVGRDGILKLEVPVGLSEVDLEVMVIVHPASSAPVNLPEAMGWRPGFFEQTAGAWAGEPLTREPQGDYETRRVLN